MNPVSFLPVIACLALALLTTYAITRRYGAPPLSGRYASIDGLRGYLAFLVFLHHACIWYFYLRSGSWAKPPSYFYTNFGQGGVALFFMITAFLFYAKLLASRERGVDWTRLYLSRLLRLTPLYLFAMALMLTIVAVLSGGRPGEPWPQLLQHLLQWLSFTALGAPDLNGVRDTAVIVAGVTWSLPYEWLFYLSLPVLALPLRIAVPRPYLLVSAALLLLLVAAVVLKRPPPHHLFAFVAGMVAAVLVQYPGFRRFADGPAAAVLTAAALGVAIFLFPSAHDALALLALAVAFALIAGGCRLFGSLTWSVSRTFGEFAYSLYLLHGIFLFVIFNFVLGPAQAQDLSPLQHWAVVAAATPALIAACYLSFRFIEQPAMLRVPALHAWLSRSPAPSNMPR
ncbi:MULTISPECIES: acyltransferase [unclassified Duganella]|uniref:acyltransferase family protein n=1 Tax=unclassified Duganella TaxID=2636909 RepID=UPI000E3523D1|nr:MULTISPECIES: acyltransferase family protein [unclassified Duganella]RFP09615.1 acyltransferase [Duganella sp. BJB475]RFP27735.1 acyltransferase [Duganella sp. BJB476]